MNCDIQNNANGVSISLIGNLLISEVDSVRNKILSSINEEKDIKLNLKDIIDCDTAGIQLIASLSKQPNLHICNVSDVVSDSALRIGYKIETNSAHVEDNIDV